MCLFVKEHWGDITIHACASSVVFIHLSVLACAYNGKGQSDEVDEVRMCTRICMYFHLDFSMAPTCMENLVVSNLAQNVCSCERESGAGSCLFLTRSIPTCAVVN